MANLLEFSLDRSAEKFAQKRSEIKKKSDDEINEIEKLQSDSQLFMEISLCFVFIILIGLFFKYLKTGKKFLKETIKNFWILIFCIISLIVCIFYVPYETRNNNGEGKFVGHAIVFEMPKKYQTKPTHLNYEEIIFRECIILASCGTGYLISTMIFKKN